MNKVSAIPPLQTTEELKKAADLLRKLADQIESGEIPAVARVGTLSSKNQFQTGVAKNEKFADIELPGSVRILDKRLAESLDGCCEDLEDDR